MARVLTLLREFFFRDMRPFWEMGLGAFIAILLAFAAMHLAWLAVHFGQTTLIILVLAACYILYLVRHISHLAYGTAEVAIGMFAIFGAMGRAPEVVSDPSTGSLLLVTHRLRRPAMEETGAKLVVSGAAPSAQRSGSAWCEKPVC
jgi:hypothetical protein